MTKHTPGPWVATPDNTSEELGEYTIRDADGGYIADVRNPYADYDMQVDYASRPDCRIEHDARLMAAAPEMLDAMRKARKCLRDNEQDREAKSAINAILVKLDEPL